MKAVELICRDYRPSDECQICADLVNNLDGGNYIIEREWN